MAKAKKALRIIVAILQIIVGAAIMAYLFLGNDKKASVIDYLGKDVVRIIILISGIVLFVTALIFIIDVIVHKKEKRMVLLTTPQGSVMITQSSLRGSVESSASLFTGVNVTKSVVTIRNGESVKAEVKCLVFDDYDFNQLGENLRQEVSKGLRTLTGIEDVNVDVVLDKSQKSEERELK
ncbi:MAG: alkaline shock response membrane anchor protein AmaP [Tissierellia bacterium]|nr:alkaline shock response membrane anchor protein AmaP [Tissierellia bacterium]